MKCRLCRVNKATTWWGWQRAGGELVKAAFCPPCRRLATIKLVPLGKVKVRS